MLERKGSPVYVRFTNYGEAIAYYTLDVIYSSMDNNLRAHLPQDQDKSMSFQEREFSSWNVKLTLETGFAGDMTWGQWKNASGTLKELYRRFGGFEFEFDIFMRPNGHFLGSGAMARTD